MSTTAIDRALAAGRLHAVHDGVYSAIPPSLMPFEAWLAAAILRGGDGARLYGLTAAWWAGLRKQRPPTIHVAVTRPRVAIDGIRWHRIHDGAGTTHRRLPIPPLRRLPLECAADLNLRDLKHLLAELEYHHDIEPHELTTKKGVRGSARLRQAIADHTPQLAHTRSELERAFIHFLTDRGLQLPMINHPIGLTTIDAVFAEQRLLVELDGVQGHRGERRVLRDHRRDLHRRGDGFTVLRYAYAQLREDGDLIEAELRRHGVPSRQ